MTASLDELLSMAVFARVVETRSFTRAAAKVGLAKSAVSARVARLEDDLGVRLLHRTTRRVAITEAGLALYERCARIVAAADEASAAAVGEDEARPVRMSVPVTLGQMHLAALVAEYLVAHPQAKVELSASDRMVDLVDEGFDLAVRIGKLRAPSLVARKLATDRVVVCASPAYLARTGEPRAPADLVGHTCLRYAQLRERDEWRFRGPDGAYAVPVSGSFVANNWTLLREAALAGLGIAVLPRFMIAAELARGALRTVLDGHRRVEVGVYAVFAHTRHIPRRVRALVDFVAQRLPALLQ